MKKKKVEGGRRKKREEDGKRRKKTKNEGRGGGEFVFLPFLNPSFSLFPLRYLRTFFYKPFFQFMFLRILSNYLFKSLSG